MHLAQKNTYKKMILISLLILVLTLTANCQSNQNKANYPHSYPYGYTIKRTVARVIDGDTFVLTDSMRVRIIGVDTPELGRFGKPSQPYADSAYLFTKSLIDGKTVKLTFEDNSFDIFGRLLAYVWLTDTNDNDSLFLQAELLKKGFARIKYYNKNKRYYHIFYNLRNTAMRNKLGIWSLE